VDALMSSPVQCAKPNMTRAQVAALMVKAEISALPIVDDEGVVTGMVTKTDVVREDYGDARWQGAAGQVGRFMTPFTLRVRERDSLHQAVGLMSEAGVHHVVVVDPDGHARGMLSALDVVSWLSRTATLAALGQDETALELTPPDAVSG
jgi:CBS domain-containing membrane protein